MLSADRLLGELALSGRLDRHELGRWLESVGIGERTAVLAFALPDPQAGVSALEHCLQGAGARGLVTVCNGLLCAIVGCAPTASVETAAVPAHSQNATGTTAVAARSPSAQERAVPDTRALATRARHELSERFGEVHAATSRAAPSSEVHQSFHEARYALDVARTAKGGPPEVTCYDDLGALKLLLSLQPQQALETYCQIVLGPVEAEDHRYGEELLRSLDAFIEHNGHWEHAAKALYCHRHTLRYRVRRVEQLTKRDFSRARDRIELWLALRGRELMH
jgi:PucR-like helix-turn-helix protein/diguanylate cyclase with GGDEF domain